MDKTYGFWDNLFLKGGAYRNFFLWSLFIGGLVFGVSITDFTDWAQVGFFFTAYVVGVPCVISLGGRDGFWGNILGLVSNVGEVAINLYFGSVGMAVSGIYFGLTHLLGLRRNKNEDNLDEDGLIKVSKLEGKQTKFTIGFLIVGIIFMLYFGDLLGFERNFSSVFYWLNIATFVISILSQYLMIIGKKEAWFGWFSSNFVNFAINGIVGNYWFMFRDVIYQANSIRTMYEQEKIK